MVSKVSVPRTGETIDASIETNIVKCKLDDQMLTKLNLYQIKDYEIGYFDSIISYGDNNEPILKHPSQDLRLGHQTIFIGDPQIREMKDKLVEQSINVTMANGITCNNVVGVRKNEDEFGNPRLDVISTLGTDYFKIRKILYSQFKLL